MMRRVQIGACTIHVVLFVMALLIDRLPAERLVTFTVLGLSTVVMVWRAGYAKQHGLWNQRITWSAEALKPERTVLVTMGVLCVSALFGVIFEIDPPHDDGSVSVIVALLMTGGLFAALIASPHNLIELVEDNNGPTEGIGAASEAHHQDCSERGSMSQPDRPTAITIASRKRYELLKDMSATNSPYEHDPIPNQDDLATWLLENEKYQQQSDAGWDLSRTDLHEAIAALSGRPTP